MKKRDKDNLTDAIEAVQGMEQTEAPEKEGYEVLDNEGKPITLAQNSSHGSVLPTKGKVIELSEEELRLLINSTISETLKTVAPIITAAVLKDVLTMIRKKKIGQ